MIPSVSKDVLMLPECLSYFLQGITETVFFNKRYHTVLMQVLCTISYSFAFKEIYPIPPVICDLQSKRVCYYKMPAIWIAKITKEQMPDLLKVKEAVNSSGQD